MLRIYGEINKMKSYCGVDIIEVNRIKDAIINTKGFREEVFTKNEIDDIILID